MAGRMHKAMSFLGLAEQVEPEDDYLDQYEQRDAVVTPIKAGDTQFRAVSTIDDSLHRIATVHPRTYNDARTIGESYREGIPVIMNLSNMSDAEAKRLVDFASGLVFAMHGALERVTAKVFLLSPPDVQIAKPEGEEKDSPDFFNQS